MKYLPIILILASIASCNSNQTKGSPLSEPPVLSMNVNFKMHPPKEQLEFVETLVKAQTASANAQNDMQRGELKSNRDKFICSNILKQRSVNNWLGTVDILDATSEGLGILGIKLADGILVSTWNNEISDANYNTLLPPSSNVFKNAKNFKLGQKVKFSGTFLQNAWGNGPRCFSEKSMTLSGNLKEPEFLFKFSDISLEEEEQMVFQEQTLSSWVQSIKSDKEISAFHVFKLYNPTHSRTSDIEIKTKWLDLCKSSPGHYCRLASYLVEADGDMKNAEKLLVQACNSGLDDWSCNRLAIYHKISKEQKDITEKENSKKCALNKKEYCFYQARSLKSKDLKEGEKQLDQLCKSGHAESCLELVSSIQKNPKKVEELLERSCKLGEGSACGYLAFNYIDSKNIDKALTYSRLGCDINDPFACGALGLAFVESNNMKEATKMSAKACMLLDNYGCYLFGILNNKLGDLAPSDSFMKLSCKYGNEAACKSLGMKVPELLL